MAGMKSGSRSRTAHGSNTDTSKKWIAGAVKRPGALRKTLGVKKGETIPADKLEKATHSKNPTTARRARLAQTLKKLSKRK